MNPAVAAAVGLAFVCPVFFVVVAGSAIPLPWHREFVVLDASAPGADIYVNGRRVGQSPVAAELAQFADRFLFGVGSSASTSGPAQSSDGRIPFSITSDKAQTDSKLEPFRQVAGRGPYVAEFRYRSFVGEGTLKSVTVHESPFGRSARFEFDVRFPDLDTQVQRLAAKARLDEGQVSSGWLAAVDKLGDWGLAALCAKAYYWWPGQPSQALYDDCPMGDPVLRPAVEEALRRRFRIRATGAEEDAVAMAGRIMAEAETWDWSRFPAWQQALLLLGDAAAPTYRARILGARAYPLFHSEFFDSVIKWGPRQDPDDVACVMLAKTAPAHALAPLVWASRGRWLISEPQFEAIARLGTDEAAHFIGRMLVDSSGVPFFMRKLLMRRGAKGIAALVATKNPVALDYLRRARQLPQFQDVDSSAAILAGLIQFGDDRAVEEAVPLLLKATAQPVYVDAVVPTLAERGDKKCVRALERVLRESRYEKARQAAGWNLAKPKSLEAFEALRRTVNASEKDSLVCALRGLARRGRPDSKALLLSIAEGRNTGLKVRLARCVAKQPHLVPFDVCVKLAKEADPEVRMQVSEALWRLASRRGMALLATMTNDPDGKVRAAAKGRLDWLRRADGVLRPRARSPGR